MAGQWKVTLDQAAIERMATSAEFGDPVGRAADAIGSAITAMEPRAEAVVETYDFSPTPRARNRAASRVVVKDGRAATWAVRDGLLMRAATAVGLRFKAHR